MSTEQSRVVVAGTLLAVLLIGFAALADRSLAGDALPKHQCEPGGTYCPRRTDPAFCPEPKSDANYYCDTDAHPQYCMDTTYGSCLDLTPADAPSGAYPCGFQHGCKTGVTIRNSENQGVLCSQVYSRCMSGS